MRKRLLVILAVITVICAIAIPTVVMAITSTHSVTTTTTVSTVNTVGGTTFTADQLLGGLIIRGGTQTAVMGDYPPTAASIVSDITSPVVGTSFHFWIINTSNHSEMLEAPNGIGVTMFNNSFIQPIQTNEYLAVITAVTPTPQVTIYSLSEDAVISVTK